MTSKKQTAVKIGVALSALFLCAFFAGTLGHFDEIWMPNGGRVRWLNGAGSARVGVALDASDTFNFESSAKFGCVASDGSSTNGRAVKLGAAGNLVAAAGATAGDGNVPVWLVAAGGGTACVTTVLGGVQMYVETDGGVTAGHYLVLSAGDDRLTDAGVGPPTIPPSDRKVVAEAVVSGGGAGLHLAVTDYFYGPPSVVGTPTTGYLMAPWESPLEALSPIATVNNQVSTVAFEVHDTKQISSVTMYFGSTVGGSGAKCDAGIWRFDQTAEVWRTSSGVPCGNDNNPVGGGTTANAAVTASGSTVLLTRGSYRLNCTVSDKNIVLLTESGSFTNILMNGGGAVINGLSGVTNVAATGGILPTGNMGTITGVPAQEFCKVVFKP